MTRFTVNGVEYDSVQEDREGAVFLSSSRHPQTFLTTMEELQTQYGVKTAFFVQQALNDMRLKGARRA